MERAGNRKREQFNRSCFRRQLDELFTCGSVTRRHVIFRTKVIRNLKNARIVDFFTKVSDCLHGKTYNADHSALTHVRSLLHGKPAETNQPKTILERHDARKYQRGILAEAQTRRGATIIDDVRFGIPQTFKSGEARKKDSGLALSGRIELVGGTFKANFRQIITDDLVCLSIQFTNTSRRIIQFAPHSNSLSSLTRKQNSGLTQSSTLTVNQTRLAPIVEKPTTYVTFLI